VRTEQGLLTYLHCLMLFIVLLLLLLLLQGRVQTSCWVR
jgi:hypothetical protein